MQTLAMDTASVPVNSDHFMQQKLASSHDGAAAQFTDSEPSISPETCKSQLGERTFNILRQSMLQQQETFIEQLWDLHRLTRTQHRKAALLPTNPLIAEEKVPNDVFSRDAQELKRARTMEALFQLPTIPASVRRRVAASDAAQKDTSQGDAVARTTDGVSMSCTVSKACAPATSPEPTHPILAPKCPEPAHPILAPKPVTTTTGPFFPAGLHGDVGCQYPRVPGQAGFPFPDMGPGSTFAWASANPHLAGSAFSNTLAMHGQPSVPPSTTPQYLAGLQQYGGVGLASVPQLPADKQEAGAPTAAPMAQDPKSPTKDTHAVSPQQAQVDVSSLLGMMAPGLQPMPDMHQQWFQRNVSRSSVPMNPQAISPALLSLQKVMDVPVPEIQEANTKAATQTTGDSSQWSADCLFMPAGLQAQKLAQQQLEGMRDNRFAGLPSAAAMMMPEPVTAKDAPVPLGLVEKDAPKSATGTCHRDESAASILMSLKGSSHST